MAYKKNMNINFIYMFIYIIHYETSLAFFFFSFLVLNELLIIIIDYLRYNYLLLIQKIQNIEKKKEQKLSHIRINK